MTFHECARGPWGRLHALVGKFASQLPELCRCSIYSLGKCHQDGTAGLHRERWLVFKTTSLKHLSNSDHPAFANICSRTATYNNLRPQNILPLISFSQHPKVRNVFNLDFPDSNHLAKTLTVVSGLDTVNLTYHNFFASKEKVAQVINCWNSHFSPLIHCNLSYSCIHKSVILPPPSGESVPIWGILTRLTYDVDIPVCVSA